MDRPSEDLSPEKNLFKILNVSRKNFVINCKKTIKEIHLLELGNDNYFVANEAII